MNVSWINGVFETQDWTAEINTHFGYVSIDNANGDTLYLQGDEAYKAMEEIVNIWEKQNCSIIQAIEIWGTNL
jgi:hypothetical protein